MTQTAETSKHMTYADLQRCDKLPVGAHAMLPEDEYHADPCEVPSLSKSIAHELLSKSPRHAWHIHPRLNPKHQPRESARFDLGTAAHDLLLLGKDARIAVIQANDWRTKAAQAQRDEARKNGLLPLLAKHNASARMMADAARKAIESSELAGVLDAGDAELSLIWREGPTYCRSRLDWITADRAIILDYKTTECAEPEAWSRGHLSQLGYDIQAEFYPRGVKAIYKVEPRFVFLVQEITYPYACSFVSLSNEWQEVGQGKVSRAEAIWRQCMSTNHWPGYPTRVAYAEPKQWQLEEHEMNKHAGDSAPVSDEDAAADCFTGGRR